MGCCFIFSPVRKEHVNVGCSEQLLTGREGYSFRCPGARPLLHVGSSALMPLLISRSGCSLYLLLPLELLCQPFSASSLKRNPCRHFKINLMGELGIIPELFCVELFNFPSPKKNKWIQKPIFNRYLFY